METAEAIKLEIAIADFALTAESDNHIEKPDAEAPSLDSGDPTKPPKLRP